MREIVTVRAMRVAARAMSSTTSTESLARIASFHVNATVDRADSSMSAGHPTSTPDATRAWPAITAASHPGWVGKPWAGRHPSGLSGRLPTSRWARV